MTARYTFTPATSKDGDTGDGEPLIHAEAWVRVVGAAYEVKASTYGETCADGSASGAKAVCGSEFWIDGKVVYCDVGIGCKGCGAAYICATKTVVLAYPEEIVAVADPSAGTVGYIHCDTVRASDDVVSYYEVVTGWVDGHGAWGSAEANIVGYVGSCAYCDRDADVGVEEGCVVSSGAAVFDCGSAVVVEEVGYYVVASCVGDGRCARAKGASIKLDAISFVIGARVTIDCATRGSVV